VGRRAVVLAPDPAKFVPPAGLSAESQVLWAGFAADLIGIHGALADVDGLLLEEVLRTRDRLDQVREKLAADGPTVTGSRGQTRPHPLLDMERALQRDMAVGLKRLGLAERVWQDQPQADGRIKRYDPYAGVRRA
jgi:hypothetical protein